MAGMTTEEILCSPYYKLFTKENYKQQVKQLQKECQELSSGLFINAIIDCASAFSTGPAASDVRIPLAF